MSQKPELEQQEQLNQLSKKELVKIILAQPKIIEELKIEIEKLKISKNLDSKISSKPPSSDLLTKAEKKDKSSEKKPKNSPGGQLGHQGQTRKGFGRVDRYEVLKAENCLSCGELLTWAKSIQQKCQAHLRRHCQRLIKTSGVNNRAVGLALREIVDSALRQHRLWREHNHRQQYLDSATQLKSQINLTLSQWSEKAGYEAGKLLRNLTLKADQWWYFLDHPEIASDHNLAERALRLALTKRKAAFG